MLNSCVHRIDGERTPANSVLGAVPQQRHVVDGVPRRRPYPRAGRDRQARVDATGLAQVAVLPNQVAQARRRTGSRTGESLPPEPGCCGYGPEEGLQLCAVHSHKPRSDPVASEPAVGDPPTDRSFGNSDVVSRLGEADIDAPLPQRWGWRGGGVAHHRLPLNRLVPVLALPHPPQPARPSIRCSDR